MRCASDRTQRRDIIAPILAHYESFAREVFWPRMQRMIITSLRRPLIRLGAKRQCISIAPAEDKESKSLYRGAEDVQV